MGVEHTCFDQILFLAIYTGSLDLRRGGGADISDPVACFVAGPDCYWGYEHDVVKDRFDGNEAAYLNAGLGRGGGGGGILTRVLKDTGAKPIRYFFVPVERDAGHAASNHDSFVHLQDAAVFGHL